MQSPDVMRLVLAMVLAGLVALPLSVSAQDAAEGAAAEPSAEEPVTEKPSAEPAPEEPALQLKLDEAGVEVTPTPPRTFGGYTLEELELRKRRAAFSFIAPAALIIAGVPLLVVGTSGDCGDEYYVPDRCWPLLNAGAALTAAGGLGMIATSILVGVRKADLKLPVHDYTVEELELRVKRAETGLYVSAGVAGAGMAIFLVASFVALDQWGEDEPFDRAETAMLTGGVLLSAGLVGTIASGILLRSRKRDRDWLRRADYGTPRRVQWDPARSRFVF